VNENYFFLEGLKIFPIPKARFHGSFAESKYPKKVNLSPEFLLCQKTPAPFAGATFKLSSFLNFIVN